jgi:hypothetical protein
MNTNTFTLRQAMTEAMSHDISHAELMLTTAGSCAPLFILRKGDEIIVIPTPWRDEGEKDEYLKLVRALCITHDCWAVTAIHEAWMSTYVADSKESVQEIVRNATPPSQAKDRVEIIIALALYRGDDGHRHVMHRFHTIERNDRGQVTGLGVNLDRDDRPDTLFGKMIEAMPDGPVTPAQRKAAKQLLVGRVENRSS